MKKMCLILVAFAVVLTGANAQELKFGLKGGPSIATEVFNDYDGNLVTLGYHFGGYVEIEFLEQFSIQPEVLFSTQGSRFEDYMDPYYELWDDRHITNYLTVPVLAKFYPTKGFNIHVGPQIGFLLSATNKYSEWTFETDQDMSYDVDVKDHFKNLDVGIAMGLGYELEAGLNFTARYILGVSDINDYKGVSEFDYEETSTDKIKNQVFQFALGYSFIK